MDLNIRTKTRELLEQNIRENLGVLSLVKDSLYTTQKAQLIKIAKLGITKVWNFCTSTDTVRKMKGQAWEKIFANYNL